VFEPKADTVVPVSIGVENIRKRWCRGCAGLRWRPRLLGLKVYLSKGGKGHSSIEAKELRRFFRSEELEGWRIKVGGIVVVEKARIRRVSCSRQGLMCLGDFPALACKNGSIVQENYGVVKFLNTSVFYTCQLVSS
jgi:hypothetical protein